MSAPFSISLASGGFRNGIAPCPKSVDSVQRQNTLFINSHDEIVGIRDILYILFGRNLSSCCAPLPMSASPRRSKSEEGSLGRPSTLSNKQKQEVQDDLVAGMSISAIARKSATSRQTIMRMQDEGVGSVSTLSPISRRSPA